MGAPDSIWHDEDALTEYYQSMAVPLNPQAGILIASILVSILGSYATLLLLGRRTSSRGIRNTALLVLAAICFAAVAVWGMHFVSMISVRLQASPDLTWYLRFSPGFTVMSLFVPLLAVTFAFWFLGSELELQYWRIVVSGILVGLTIGLMHYSASFRLPYLNVSYTAVTVVFALILACVAATAALFLFFRLRAQWQDSFWKRCICALFLATAVCGMHYLGLGGSSYRVKAGVTPAQLGSSRAQSVRLTIAIAIMCAIIIVLSIVIAIVDFLVRRDVRRIARQIVVASATFDRQGRLLVRPDGTLPMQLIETNADLKDVLEELDPRQSTFQWLYTLSFDWAILRPFMPRITASIASRRAMGATARAKEARQATKQRGKAAELALFRNRFVEAVVELAHELDLPIERIGKMFDRVLTTGTKSALSDEKSALGEDEFGSTQGITLRVATSEGVMLFVVRELGSLGLKSADPTDSVEYYAAKGYRLAETRFFAPILAERVGVSKTDMDVFLSACKTYAKRGTRSVVQSRGTYLGLFGVRPSPVRGGGLDVLVYNFARHQIPAYRLPDVVFPMTPRIHAWLRELTNCTMHQALARCTEAVQAKDAEADRKSVSSEETISDDLYEFQAALATAIEAVAIALRSWPQIYHTARMSSEVLDIPASEDDSAPPAQMIVLEVVLPSPEVRLSPIQSHTSGASPVAPTQLRHETDEPPAPFVYTPYSLFSKTQMMLLRGKAHAEFARSMSHELAKLYPGRPQDVEAELAAADKAGDVSDPFRNMHTLATIADEIEPGTPGTASSKDRPRSLAAGFRRPWRLAGSSSDASHSEDGDVDLEKGTDIQQVSGSVQTLPSRKRASEPPRANSHGGQEENADMKGIYAAARLETDGWFTRCLRTLEESSSQKDALAGVRRV